MHLLFNPAVFVLIGVLKSITIAANEKAADPAPPYAPEQIMTAWGEHAAGRLSKADFEEMIRVSDEYLKAQSHSFIDVESPPSIE